MQTHNITQTCDGKTYHHSLIFDASQTGPRPGVLLYPGFDNRSEFLEDYATKLAKLGYAALAVDMYGDGACETTFEGCIDKVMPLIEDRAENQKRVLSAFDAFKAQDNVELSKIAALGFCYGGLCALDLARSGADITGAVTFHGNLSSSDDITLGDIKAKILVLHGYDDPQIGPENLPIFAKEMNSNDVDWQVHFFSHTKHAFTEPKAAEFGPPEFGRVYNPDSARRAYDMAVNFFAEVLA